DEKRSLHDEFNADICEMEAAGIALTCNRSSVPCLLIKAVSDAVEGGAEEFAREIDRCAELCLETLEGVVSGLLS
ncbi:MAG: 5'-methylthioadenosine nucleosidase, partial [Clostridium sp.]|nr:5'-methylthioadenosine nucleosidase [Clostridium sp.]